MGKKRVKPENPFYDMQRAPGIQPRWTATVWYRTDAGIIDVEHTFEELDMLHDLVESGPSFFAIDRIEVKLSGNIIPSDSGYAEVLGSAAR